MAIDLYSKTKTVDFGGSQATPGADSSLSTEEFIGDAYDGLLWVNYEHGSDGPSELTVKVSATSDFSASAATCASAAVNAIISDCDAEPTVTGGKISAATGANAYVFYVSKLKPYVKLYCDATNGTNGEMQAVLVATNLAQAPAKYSDATGSY